MIKKTTVIICILISSKMFGQSTEALKKISQQQPKNYGIVKMVFHDCADYRLLVLGNVLSPRKDTLLLSIPKSLKQIKLVDCDRDTIPIDLEKKADGTFKELNFFMKPYHLKKDSNISIKLNF